MMSETGRTSDNFPPQTIKELHLLTGRVYIVGGNCRSINESQKLRGGMTAYGVYVEGENGSINLKAIVSVDAVAEIIY